jgi:predicted nucleic acid-binding Zn ribbon protein
MKANCNGYVQVSNTKGGRTYQHIVEAELKIGRKIEKGEVVHHIDENRSNNTWDNLMVFKSTSDHMRHHGLKPEDQRLEQLEDGSFRCISLKVKQDTRRKIAPVRSCLVCGKQTKNLKFCSLDCSNSLNSPRELTRKASSRVYGESLHKLVWSIPIEVLGKQLGVNGNSIRKWCKKENIETPNRGFWNKLQAGKFEALYCPLFIY